MAAADTEADADTKCLKRKLTMPRKENTISIDAVHQEAMVYDKVTRHTSPLTPELQEALEVYRREMPVFVQNMEELYGQMEELYGQIETHKQWIRDVPYGDNYLEIIRDNNRLVITVADKKNNDPYNFASRGVEHYIIYFTGQTLKRNLHKIKAYDCQAMRKKYIYGGYFDEFESIYTMDTTTADKNVYISAIEPRLRDIVEYALQYCANRKKVV